jgi:hypothetical protein
MATGVWRMSSRTYGIDGAAEVTLALVHSCVDCAASPMRCRRVQARAYLPTGKLELPAPQRRSSVSTHQSSETMLKMVDVSDGSSVCNADAAGDGRASGMRRMGGGDVEVRW